jgi:hypothetical protein
MILSSQILISVLIILFNLTTGVKVSANVTENTLDEAEQCGMWLLSKCGLISAEVQKPGRCLYNRYIRIAGVIIFALYILYKRDSLERYCRRVANEEYPAREFRPRFNREVWFGLDIIQCYADEIQQRTQHNMNYFRKTNFLRVWADTFFGFIGRFFFPDNNIRED